MLKDITKISDVATAFENLGGVFVSQPTEIAEKLAHIKAFVFDWDGVFNDGIKSCERTSGFSEADAMGMHILRYAYWRATGSIPLTAIITAQKNDSAVKFAEREHLTKVFYNYKNKYLPIEAISNELGLRKENIATTFDDIIDYPLAQSGCLRFLINRKASPLFQTYFRKNNLCDYITANESPNHPIREICEMVVGLMGIYDEVLLTRFTETEKYAEFWKMRNIAQTELIAYT